MGITAAQWDHLGVSCFPEVSNIEKFKGICFEDRKMFILTKQELDDSTYKWWDDIQDPSRKPSTNDCYKDIASLMAGSFYVSSADHKKNKITDDSKERLVGDTINITVTSSDLKIPLFSGLKNQPLGSIPSIIFWNQDQLMTLQDLESNPHTILMVLQAYL